MKKAQTFYVLLLTITYLWMFQMSDLSVALKSTEKLYTFPFKEISLELIVPNVYDMDMLFRQNWGGKLTFLL